jgi:hypothetical protein
MSVTTVDNAGAPVAAAPAGRYGMVDLIRSEWTKVRTVRSTMWTLGMTLLVGLAASGIATGVTRAHWATMSASNRVSSWAHTSAARSYSAFLASWS